jgi:hypothetical protein
MTGPRKTDAGNPTDWMDFAADDLAVVHLAWMNWRRVTRKAGIRGLTSMNRIGPHWRA